MEAFDRNVCRTFHLDANRINSRESLPNMNQLEKWHENGVIQIQMSEIAQNEAARGDQNRASKARNYIYTITMGNTPGETQMMQKIENILFLENAATTSERNDVEIVFNAYKYGSILVTNDGASKSQPNGILGKREELAKLGIEVMTDTQAVAVVRKLIAERDRRVIQRARRAGAPIPSWVGQD